ncbi:putative ribonuclease H-like domain-containing protein [Tanacetum coccineum]
MEVNANERNKLFKATINPFTSFVNDDVTSCINLKQANPLTRKYALSFMRPFGYPVTILNTIDHLGKARMETIPVKDYILLPLSIQDLSFSSSLKDSLDAGFKPSGEEEKKDAEDPGNEDSEMDVKSTFLYGKIKKEVYVCQPPGFEDLDFPDRVYKVEKALYGLHQAPRAWYETLSTYLLDNGFQRGKIDKTLFIKRDKSDLSLVQVYVNDIIFGSTKKKMCTEFEKMMHEKIQMSSMGELTFFLGLQVKQKEDGIFISQDKYVNEILNKFGFSDVKTARTPMETQKALLKDADGEDVDEHLYRSVIGSLMYLTSSRPDIMFSVCKPKLGLWYPKDSPFDLVAYTDRDYIGASLDRKSTTGGCQFLGCRLISWQCKKQTVVANSTTKAGYIAASNCYRKSTICIVKNPVFHSKTKHIEIRHHFIRDSNEKKLIQMIKIHTDQNVADLLTKAFDGRLIGGSSVADYTLNDDWMECKIATDGIEVNAGDSKLMLLGIHLLLPVLVNAVRHKLTTAG